MFKITINIGSFNISLHIQRKEIGKQVKLFDIKYDNEYGKR